MPNNTGIKNREKYIERVLKEDKGHIGKNTPYGRYLGALKELVRQTNELFEQGGYMDKDSYEQLVNQYMAVARHSIEFRDSGDSQTRRNVVEHIFKLISKDLKALNNMDKENPGNIRKAFEASRAVIVKVPDGLSHKVGGQSSARFPMKTVDGKKGFFTARSDTANEKGWNELIDSIFNQFKLTDKEKEAFNKIRTDSDFRSQLVQPLYNELTKEEVDLANISVILGLYEDKASADADMKNKKELQDAVVHFVDNSVTMFTPYNLQERLGYDPYTRNDNKNAAMYDVARLLGCNRLIAKAVPMVVINGDQVIKGTFMEHAEGSDLANLKKDDPIVNMDPNNAVYNKSLYRDLADLQVLDFICGNIDRHKQNMFYKTEQKNGEPVKITGITAIDNDACFPEKEIPEDEFDYDDVERPPRIYKPENFRYINRETAEIILNLRREQLETALRGHNLSLKAIKKAWDRTLQVKDVLREMQKNNITYVEEMEEKTYSNPKDENNPFRDQSEDYNKASIFTGFNTQVKQLVDVARADLVSEEKDNDAPIAKAEKMDKATLLLSDFNQIESMNIMMKRINMLKSPSKEFARMSRAMFSLYEYSQQLARNMKGANKTLTMEAYDEYEKRMNTMRDAVRNYIKEKGTTPKTEIGRERHAVALKLLRKAELLFDNFEAVKELEDKEKYRTGKSIINEAKMYTNIKPTFKDRNGKEINAADLGSDTLNRVIENLLERKAILDKLSGNIPYAEYEKILYGRLADNDNYFVSMSEEDRNTVKEAMAGMAPEIARTKEWQALHMAFIATENIAAYKAVEKINATMETMKVLKADIDAARKYVEEKKAEINKVFPDLTFENAEDQYKKAETERTRLENELKTAEENLKKASEGLDDKKKNLTDVYNKDIEELTKKYQPTLDTLRAEKTKLSQQKQEIVNAATEKAIQAMKQDGKAEEKGKIVFDEKTNSDIAALDQQINKISGELKKGERQFNIDKKKITDTYSAEVKKLETPVEMNSRKVRMIMNKVNGKKNLMEAAKKFMNHAEYCGTAALDAALEKANVMEKLDINAVMQSVQNTAASLMKMAELDGETHKNSKEFNTMVRDLKVVMNWGKDDTLKNSMINPPHTMEQALEKLKASSKKYLEEKDKQWRPNPSQRRYMHKQLANNIGILAEQSLETLGAVNISQKTAESWNRYFKSGCKTEILEEQKNAVENKESEMEDERNICR